MTTDFVDRIRNSLRDNGEEALAVNDCAEVMTYAALGGAVDRTIEEWQLRGLRSGDRIVIDLPRGVALMTALLTCIVTGVTYVPVQRQAGAPSPYEVAQRVGARWLLTDVAAPPEHLAITEPRLGPAASYIMFTSGSTGTPKAIEVPLHYLAAAIDGLLERINPPAGATWYGTAPPTFDPSLVDMLGPVLTRGTWRPVDKASLARPIHLLNEICASPASVVQAPPTIWRHLIRRTWQLDEGSEAIALVGGERLPSSLAAELSRRGLKVWNLYGPTETVIWVSASRYRDEEHHNSVPLGEPFPYASFEVTKESELIILGLTAAVNQIGTDPAPAVKPATYRTGDVVDRVDDRLYFRGRVDDQVKIGGVRLNLQTVDERLSKMPGVIEAAAVAIETRRERGGEALAAMVVLAPGHELSDVRRRVAEVEPRYLRPTLLVSVRQLPRLTSGKTDRRQVRELLLGDCE